MNGAQTEEKLHILRILLRVNELSAPYNQFTLPLLAEQEITLCSYFAPEVALPVGLKLYAGGGTLPGFLRALGRALAGGPYDVIHVHAPHLGLIFLLRHFFNGRLRRRALYTVHNSFQSYKLRNQLLLLPVLAWFRRIVFCSHASQASFPPLFRRLAGPGGQAIQNGLNIPRVDAESEGDPAVPPAGAFTVVTIGRLISIKNPLALVAALQQLDSASARLAFIGQGRLRQQLLDAAAAAGLAERVLLTGLIPRSIVYQTLRAADLYVSPSRGEGLPIAALEAMACRLPVILSNIPPHREIAAGVDFIPLVPPDDAAGFAREIGRIMALSPGERAELGRRCRGHVEAHFSMAEMHRHYEALYREIISEAAA